MLHARPAHFAFVPYGVCSLRASEARDVIARLVRVSFTPLGEIRTDAMTRERYVDV